MVCEKYHPSRFFLPCKSAGKNIVEFYIEKKLFFHRKKVFFVQKKTTYSPKKDGSGLCAENENPHVERGGNFYMGEKSIATFFIYHSFSNLGVSTYCYSYYL